MKHTKLTVHITEEDIEMGKQNFSCFCPIARALDRSTNITCAVDLHEIKFLRGESSFRMGTPSEAANFIRAFDAGEPVEPFHFDVCIPTRLLPVNR